MPETTTPLDLDSRISERCRTVPPSGIRRFFEIAATMKDVISLGIGEPDFVSPQPVIDAAVVKGPLAEHYQQYWRQSVVQAIAADALNSKKSDLGGSERGSATGGRGHVLVRPDSRVGPARRTRPRRGRRRARSGRPGERPEGGWVSANCSGWPGRPGWSRARPGSCATSPSWTRSSPLISDQAAGFTFHID